MQFTYISQLFSLEILPIVALNIACSTEAKHVFSQGMQETSKVDLKPGCFSKSNVSLFERIASVTFVSFC